MNRTLIPIVVLVGQETIDRLNVETRRAVEASPTLEGVAASKGWDAAMVVGGMILEDALDPHPGGGTDA